MIFLTTGTQQPFDRLLKVVDEIAYQLSDTIFVVQAFKSQYQVKNGKRLEFISPEEFNTYFDKADLIIGHAGMGTIISALVKKKPIIVMPRLVQYNEHRNDHQVATAKKFDALGYIRVAYNEEELKTKFFEMWPNNIKPLHNIGNWASNELMASLRNFMNNPHLAERPIRSNVSHQSAQNESLQKGEQTSGIRVIETVKSI